MHSKLCLQLVKLWAILNTFFFIWEADTEKQRAVATGTPTMPQVSCWATGIQWLEPSLLPTKAYINRKLESGAEMGLGPSDIWCGQYHPHANIHPHRNNSDCLGMLQNCSCKTFCDPEMPLLGVPLHGLKPTTCIGIFLIVLFTKSENSPNICQWMSAWTSCAIAISQDVSHGIWTWEGKQKTKKQSHAIYRQPPVKWTQLHKNTKSEKLSKWKSNWSLSETEKEALVLGGQRGYLMRWVLLAGKNILEVKSREGCTTVECTLCAWTLHLKWFVICQLHLIKNKPQKAFLPSKACSVVVRSKSRMVVDGSDIKFLRCEMGWRLSEIWCVPLPTCPALSIFEALVISHGRVTRDLNLVQAW